MVYLNSIVSLGLVLVLLVLLVGIQSRVNCLMCGPLLLLLLVTWFVWDVASLMAYALRQIAGGFSTSLGLVVSILRLNKFSIESRTKHHAFGGDLRFDTTGIEISSTWCYSTGALVSYVDIAIIQFVGSQASTAFLQVLRRWRFHAKHGRVVSLHTLDVVSVGWILELLLRTVVLNMNKLISVQLDWHHRSLDACRRLWSRYCRGVHLARTAEAFMVFDRILISFRGTSIRPRDHPCLKYWRIWSIPFNISSMATLCWSCVIVLWLSLLFDDLLIDTSLWIHLNTTGQAIQSSSTALQSAGLQLTTRCGRSLLFLRSARDLGRHLHHHLRQWFPATGWLVDRSSKSWSWLVPRINEQLLAWRDTVEIRLARSHHTTKNLIVVPAAQLFVAWNERCDLKITPLGGNPPLLWSLILMPLEVGTDPRLLAKDLLTTHFIGRLL